MIAVSHRGPALPSPKRPDELAQACPKSGRPAPRSSHPVELGCHSSEPVPVAIRGPGLEAAAVEGYAEERAAKGSLGMLEGDGLIRLRL